MNKMFPHASNILYVLAVAISILPALSSAVTVGDTCTTGTLECCKYVGPLDTPAQTYLEAYAIHVTNTTTDIGINCTPVATFSDTASSACADQLACCTGKVYRNGVVVLGCTPLTLVSQ
ncbi:hypothetical protein EDD18DRAFT_1461307 [Armillaria luteobubalina]|uniref:Hydrophobin n=1 Tax=Armillaria luteobubalina TaxID=153913 RepID=A0AA39Q8J5_9AGAR|nr:hypothetical protein EDD18DRAFT_1461307 [Armillaria luteobubalina]